MGTTTVETLEQRLAEQISDYIQVIVTTAIGADNSIVSTNLNAYDGGRDDYFNGWWVYITDHANITVHRQISDYATSGGTLTVRGAALSDDCNLSTIRLHRYNRDKYITAFADTAREIYPFLYQSFDISELVTGNILPNSHFRDWAVSTYPDKYALSNVTAVASTTAGTYRGGAKSAKVTASAANGYMYITSDSWPKLLDLMGKTVSLYVWASPEVANDATVKIWTKQADGTEQDTLVSTTACPAGEYTLLKLENQTLNDDLVEVQLRLGIATNAKYVYFDHARVTGHNIDEYLLPVDLRDGDTDEVFIQTTGYSDKICDDLHPRYWEKVYGYDILNDGTDKYLRLPALYTSNRLIRLKGRKPLSVVSAYTSTIETNDGGEVNLFIAYAKYKLFSMVKTPVSSEDVRRYREEIAEAYGEYRRLLAKHRMPVRSYPMHLPAI